MGSFESINYKKKATGYITELSNLIPACGKCNQSKGNKYWSDWIISDAKLSPKTRGIKNLNEKIELIKKYEIEFKPTKYDFRKLVGQSVWDEYMSLNDKIHTELRAAQNISDEIKRKILKSISGSNN